ncbi:uncharacterized protein PFL1_04711 [Pseudozyma flocculosa PF-1]|uniref:DNA replication factor Cdt1 C-terminal domain-containing protein n=2 Tax=Pseudozyma flocculosa TaxID=84751 RepID=A0A5C3F770_9BASI|nr:uncharacterized protein PFL1_04711 [Pseudozyma flocculosa PF-1]EPQ27573.1 hypothetical protein PFL1_04711 [Pseudozyma flocculosa PF-1]SPO39299.1 uncharacterized protein PSFLO_04779 [Pseudozyma flocculosa]
MAGGGITSHFRSGKASLAARKPTSAKEQQALRDGLTKVPSTDAVAKGKGAAAVASATNTTTATATPTTMTTTTTRRTRSTRTQLRTPQQGEVEAILKDLDDIQSSSSSHPAVLPSSISTDTATTAPASASSAAAAFARSITPPPLPDPTSPYLLGTPPRTAHRRSNAATSPSKRKAAAAADAAGARTSAAPTSSPTKRKARASAEGTEGPSTEKLMASPTKVARVGSPTAVKEADNTATDAAADDDDDDDDDDGLVLTPGRNMGTRISLASPKAPLLASSSSPLDHRSPTATLPRSLARRIMEDEDDESFLTPRSVRERPKGHIPQLLPMGARSAIFQPGTVASGGSSSRSGASTPKSARVGSATTKEQASVATPLRDSPASLSLKLQQEASKQADPPLPEVKHVLSSELPLPKHYASLMTLHMALEHALVVHLATCGASMASLENDASSDDAASDDDGAREASFVGGEENSAVMTSGTPRRRQARPRTVRLPNLVTYTAIRPLVERSGGRRLGPTELARLASVWMDFQAPSADAPSSSSASAGAGADEIKGLGFIVSRTRTLDARTGRRVWDWGIGIELEVRRPRRAKTPPVQVEFGGVGVGVEATSAATARGVPTPSTPGASVAVDRSRFATPPPSPASSRLDATPTPASPSKRRREQSGSLLPSSPSLPSSPRSTTKAREGMSFVALWNNGIEVRKAEVGRRLRQRCGRFHQLWLDEQAIVVPEAAPPQQHAEAKQQERSTSTKLEPSTPSTSGPWTHAEQGDARERGQAMQGQGGLWTPSATRSGGRRVGGRTITFDQSNLDRDGLLDSDVSADEAEADGSAATMTGQESIKTGGRKALMAELQPTPRQQRPRPATTAASPPTTTTTTAESAKDEIEPMPGCVDGDGWPVPHAGMVLYEWHPRFDRDSAAIVRPVPLVELPPLRDPVLAAPSSSSASNTTSTPTVPGGRHVRLGGGGGGGAGSVSSNLFGLGLGIQHPSTPQTSRVANRPGMTPSSASSATLSASGSGPGSGLSLKDRIRQKEEAKRNLLLAKSSNALLSRATPGTPASHTPSTAGVGGSAGAAGTPTRSSMMATLSRRSVLSRLPELAGIVYVIFTSSSGSGGGGGGGARTPTLPMSDVVTRLCKSVKTTMSRAECRDAVELLRDEVDGFLDIVVVGGKEWVRMGRRHGGAPWSLQEVRERIGVAISRG